MTILVVVYNDSSVATDQYIIDQAGIIEIVANDGSGTLKATFTTSAGSITLTDTTYTQDQYNKISFGWTGATAVLNVNGTLKDSAALGGTTNTTANPFAMGGDFDGVTTYSQTLEGRIEAVWVWDKVVSGAAGTNVLNNYEGALFTTIGGDHTFEPGDLIIQNPDRVDQSNVIVTQDVSALSFRGIPFGDRLPNFGNTYVHVGSCFNESRQTAYVIRDKKTIVLVGIDTFEKYLNNANASAIIGEGGVDSQGRDLLKYMFMLTSG